MLDLHDAHAVADRMLASGSAAGDSGGEPPKWSAAALARARTAYERAERHLIAAEEDYARARLALRQAQARLRRVTPLPGHQYHYLCGHAAMETWQRDTESTFSLCPACRRLLDTASPPFTQIRSLVMKEPDQSDTPRSA